MIGAKDRVAGTARRIVRGGRLRSAVTVLLTGSLLGQGVIVLATPVLSRLYEPADLGLFAVFSSVESILVVVAALRYDQAMATASSEEDAANLLGVALVVSAATSVAVVVAALLFGGPLGDMLHLGEVRPYAGLLAVSLAGDAAYQALSLWAIRRNDYRQVAKTKALQGVAQSGGQIGLGIAGLQPAGLLIGWTLGRCAGAGRLARSARRDQAFHRMSLAKMRLVSRRFRRFPTLTMPASLLNAASLQLPGILLAAAYDARVAGWFLLATRLTSMPMTVMGQSLSQAFIGHLSPAEGRTSRSTSVLVRRTAKTLVAVATIPTVLVLIFAPSAFPVVFGAQWHEAGRYAQVLAPACLAQFAISPLAWVLQVQRRQGWQLGWDALRLVLVVTALMAPAALGLSDLTAVTLYSAVLVATYVLLFALVVRAASTVDPAPELEPLDTAVLSGAISK